MEQTFQTPGPIRLDLQVPAGEIEVEAAGSGETSVRLDGPDEVLERATIELRGDELRVHVRGRKGLFVSLGRSDEVRLIVRYQDAGLEVAGEHGGRRVNARATERLVGRILENARCLRGRRGPNGARRGSKLFAIGQVLRESGDRQSGLYRSRRELRSALPFRTLIAPPKDSRSICAAPEPSTYVACPPRRAGAVPFTARSELKPPL